MNQFTQTSTLTDAYTSTKYIQTYPYFVSTQVHTGDVQHTRSKSGRIRRLSRQDELPRRAFRVYGESVMYSGLGVAVVTRAIIFISSDIKGGGRGHFKK